MEREYIAFISYRHLPLDMEVAKKVQKAIEHYHIPAKFRKDGRKTLGFAFRDQDELPLASNLSEAIMDALDRSQFLILIATPDWGKSQWCRHELSYFLEHHDRDHVLVVFASGELRTSVPEDLFVIRDAEGHVVREVEPLAANIVADTATERNRKFKVEVLRILAMLIGCNFDDLRNRSRREARRKRSLFLTSAALIMMAFIVLLLVKNAGISRQYEIAEQNRLIAEQNQQIAEQNWQIAVEQKNAAQLNESRMVAKEATALLQEGKRAEAVSKLYAVLPREEDPDRPYDADAQRVLTSAL